MTQQQHSAPRSLDVQRDEFTGRRLLAMPLAGTIAWTVIALAGLTLTTLQTSLVTFIATGTIAYLGMFLSKFTGENFLDKTKPKNTFDTLFFYSVGSSVLVYAIAVPFFNMDPTSLPLTVGILTGTMWLPMSWIIQHWVGLFHGIGRTVSLVVLWYVFPSHRFIALPLAITVFYLITIYILEKRYQAIKKLASES